MNILTGIILIPQYFAIPKRFLPQYPCLHWSLIYPSFFYALHIHKNYHWILMDQQRKVHQISGIDDDLLHHKDISHIFISLNHLHTFSPRSKAGSLDHPCSSRYSISASAFYIAKVLVVVNTVSENLPSWLSLTTTKTWPRASLILDTTELRCG